MKYLPILLLFMMGRVGAHAQKRSAYIQQYPSPTGDAEIKKTADRLNPNGLVISDVKITAYIISDLKNKVRITTVDGVSRIKINDSITIYYRGVIDSAKFNGKTYEVNY